MLAGSGSQTDIAAVFKLPSLVGGGAAPLMSPREFVWRQFVTRLATGSVLVTACSDGAPARPVEKGTVRGSLHMSGYFGHSVPGVKPTSRLYYIGSADPVVKLPGWLLNLVVTKQAQNVVRLSALFRNGKLLQT